MDSDAFYEQLDRMVDEYESLEEQLQRMRLTAAQAETMMREWRAATVSLAASYDLPLANKLLFCRRLESLSPTMRLEDLLSLYVAVLSDKGLLFHCRRIGKQDIGGFLALTERMKAAQAALYRHANYSARFAQLKKLRHPLDVPHHAAATEADIAFVQREFVRCFPVKTGTAVLWENIALLCGLLASNRDLGQIAPLFLWQIARKHSSRLQTQRDFHFDLSNLWREDRYQIAADNGKNFGRYRSLIYFFLALCRYFSDKPAVDVAFSHYLFARLSNLSEWHYRHETKPDDECLEKPLRLQIAERGIECFENDPDYGCTLEEWDALYDEKDATTAAAIDACVEQFFCNFPGWLENYIQLHPVSIRQKRGFVERMLPEIRLPAQISGIRKPLLCEVVNITLDSLVTQMMESCLIRCGQNLINRLASNNK